MWWQLLFVRAPAELGRCDAFLVEAFDAPGVDEFINLLGLVTDLSIALADVNDFDIKCLRKGRVVLSVHCGFDHASVSKL